MLDQLGSVDCENANPVVTMGAVRRAACVPLCHLLYSVPMCRSFAWLLEEMCYSEEKVRKERKSRKISDL